MIHDPRRPLGSARWASAGLERDADPVFVTHLRSLLHRPEPVSRDVTARLHAGVRAGLYRRAGFAERAAVNASLAFVAIGFALQSSLTPRSALVIAAATAALGGVTAAFSTLRQRARR